MEQHRSTKRIIDTEGNLLYEELATVSLVDGTSDELVERKVSSCPSCNSRLDQVQIKGSCWTCKILVCENCSIQAKCCGRVLCNDHKRSANLNDTPISVCSEHEPVLWQLELDRIERIKNDQVVKHEIARTQEHRQWAQEKLRQQQVQKEMQLRKNDQLMKAYQLQAQVILQQSRLQWEMSRAVIEIGQRALTQTLGSTIPQISLPKGDKP